jgi:hypothetical protein
VDQSPGLTKSDIFRGVSDESEAKQRKKDNGSIPGSQNFRDGWAMEIGDARPYGNGDISGQFLREIQLLSPFLDLYHEETAKKIRAFPPFRSWERTWNDYEQDFGDQSSKGRKIMPDRRSTF